MLINPFCDEVFQKRKICSLLIMNPINHAWNDLLGPHKQVIKINVIVSFHTRRTQGKQISPAHGWGMTKRWTGIFKYGEIDTRNIRLHIGGNIKLSVNMHEQ